MKFNTLLNGPLFAPAGPPKGGGSKPAASSKEKDKEKKDEEKAKDEVGGALATTAGQALANSSIMEDILGDADAGHNLMGKDDLAIPRLKILQGLSPECQKRTDTYVEGAEPGEIMDTVSQAIFSGAEGIVVVPCTYRRTIIEWKPRKEGGGFVADLGGNDDLLRDCTRGEKGEYINAEGNNLVVTAEYFLMVYDKELGTLTPYVLSMSGANIKHSKKWNTLINTLKIPSARGPINPAMFYRAYTLTTAPESNDQGQWFAWNIKPDVNLIEVEGGEKLYLECRAFALAVKEGSVKASEHKADAPPQEKDDAPM